MDYDTAAGATIWANGRPVYDRGETVCVIGAGASGLAAIKNLKQYGFRVDCFERETGVGGALNWRHDRSPLYASAHLKSSKPFAEFPDFPMPDSWPDYPHHSQVLAYLTRYADHFDLREHIWFGTEVVHVEPAPDGYWNVTIRGAAGSGVERTQRYAAVVVATGHTWAPYQPALAGIDEFRGQVIHSSAYKDAAQLRGKRVLVIGGGDSGCDIAVEAAAQAAVCWHSMRHGRWQVPKYIHGRPTDQVRHGLVAQYLPAWARRWRVRRLMARAVGDLTRFGLPRPDHPVDRRHPVTNSLYAYYLGHGAITPLPDVARLHRASVELVSGQTVDPDLVVLATGYVPRFDFLTPDVLGAEPDQHGVVWPRLALHMFSRRYPTCAMVGMLRPDGGLFALAHWQTVVFARFLALRERAPAKAAEVWRRIGRLCPVSGGGRVPRQAGGAAAGRSGGRTGERASARAAASGAGDGFAPSTGDWFAVSYTQYLRQLERVGNDLTEA